MSANAERTVNSIVALHEKFEMATPIAGAGSSQVHSSTKEATRQTTTEARMAAMAGYPRLAVRSLRQPPLQLEWFPSAGLRISGLVSCGVITKRRSKKKNFRFKNWWVGCAMAMGKKRLLRKAGVQEEDRP